MNDIGTWLFARECRLRDDGLGLWCDADGAFLGGAPLLTARRDSFGSLRFAPRRKDEIERLLRSAYGAAFDGNTRMGGLQAVANGLNAGQECRAIIAALHMRLPDLTPSGARAIERLDRLIKAEWDESKHPRQPAGLPGGSGGEFAPAGGAGGAGGRTSDGSAARRPSAREESPEVDMTEGAMAPPRALTAEERQAIEQIQRELEAYARTSAEALGRVPEDVARLIEQFKRDPIEALRSLGPSLSGINPVLSPGTVSAARALATARGVGPAAEAGLPEIYAPPEPSAQDPVGRRGDPMKTVPRPNEPGMIGSREVSGHGFDQMQSRGVTPTIVEEAIAIGDKIPAKHDRTMYVDRKNGIAVVVENRTGTVVTVITVDRVEEHDMTKFMIADDREKIERLLRFLTAYESGEITIERLIDAVEIEYKSLKAVPVTMRRAIERKWIELEIEFATALLRSQSELTREQVGSVLEIIAELRELLKPALG